MKFLSWLGIGLLVLVAIGAVAYGTRTDPVWRISGRGLTGDVVTAPVTDWSFTDEHMTIAVETRPAAPHSVTTICFTHEGALYVPASGGSAKTWTHFAAADPRVRVKVGEKVYPARASRVTDTALVPALTAAARAKYDFPAGDDAQAPQDIWVFKLESAATDVAAPAP